MDTQLSDSKYLYYAFMVASLCCLLLIIFASYQIVSRANGEAFFFFLVGKCK